MIIKANKYLTNSDSLDLGNAKLISLLILISLIEQNKRNTRSLINAIITNINIMRNTPPPNVILQRNAKSLWHVLRILAGITTSFKRGALRSTMFFKLRNIVL